jgi:5'-methylthioadenosine phosphorylase
MKQQRIGIIGGSGLGEALAARLGHFAVQDIDTPFGRPSGPILTGDFAGRPVAFLSRHGTHHTYSPSRVPYAANIFALKSLGVTTLIASGAVGSLRREIAPKDVVLVEQFIDKTFRRRNTFFDDYGAVHVEFAQPTCRRLRDKLLAAAQQTRVKTHAAGTYVCMEGPQFSTRAESLMHQKWGGDLIGMTALPEAKLAREARMCYALVALVSDWDCWREPEPGLDKESLLKEILGNLSAATRNAIDLIETFLSAEGDLTDDACPCRHSLDLAVWTPRDAIDPEEKKKLEILFT